MEKVINNLWYFNYVELELIMGYLFYYINIFVKEGVCFMDYLLFGL